MLYASIFSVIFSSWFILTSFGLVWKPPASVGNVVPKSDYNYKTYFFKQQIDHFGFAQDGFFDQRFLVADQYWKSGGPIFFYTGNEGDVTLFAANTGFMWDIAPAFEAMVVFAEHRYYGKSMPFGSESFKDAEHLNYFTAEQALADYALLIPYIKLTWNATKSAVVAFGGSYGGMLTAWFRMKYPHVVVGGIAASAPILQFDTPCEAFSAIVAQDFEKANPNCAPAIRRALPLVSKQVKQEPSKLAAAFRVCDEARLADLNGWLQGMLGYLAMVDYPYPASFLEPLPSWPVKAACKFLDKPVHEWTDDELLKAMADVALFYVNFTGEAKCLNTSQFAAHGLGVNGWNYQSCTEMVMPSCSNGVNDFFIPSKWDFEAVTRDCQKQFGVTPRQHWILEYFGGRNLSGHSNIVFSNGDLDPWSAGGVYESDVESIVPIRIKDGAHHLDLRAATPHDPPSVIQARNIERANIRKWISEAAISS